MPSGLWCCGNRPYRLLIVDDSAANRFVLRHLLEGIGFHVLEAAGGQEAVDLCKGGQPHWIWMDLRMPGMDGNEAAGRIREAESGRRTPIIALTAGVMDKEGPPSPSLVFDGWVYKPFREAEIFEQLEKHLGVQFVYQPSGRSVAGKAPEKDGLTPADLVVLPVERLREFFQTLRKGRSASGKGRLTVFGEDYPTPDGTCIRDYINVTDLADAHVAAFRPLLEAAESMALNLGTGHGISNREVLQAIARVTGHTVPHDVGGRRPGDPAELVADPSMARKTLGWKARNSDIDTIVETAWRWHRKQAASRPLASVAGRLEPEGGAGHDGTGNGAGTGAGNGSGKSEGPRVGHPSPARGDAA